MFKTIERHIDVGKWQMKVETGHDVTAFRLKGQRNRPIELRHLPTDEFRAHLSYSPDGKVKEDAILRGMPLYWHSIGNTVQIWPAPAHQWDIEIDLRPK